MWIEITSLSPYVYADESGGELRMAGILLNEMLSRAQTSLKSMAGHIDSIIAERRAMRQSLKPLEPTVASLTKDAGGGGSQVLSGRQRRDLVDHLAKVQTSVEQLTESSSSVLQVYSSHLNSLYLSPHVQSLEL